jgi:RIB43A.
MEIFSSNKHQLLDNLLLVAALYLEKINRYIDEQEKKKETNRMQELLEIRKTLEQQNPQPKNSGGVVANGGPLSMDECGPSSIQQFDGEDNSFSDRKKKQQHQFREWCEQDIALKRKRRMQEKELEKQIASQILEQDQIRCKIALEEEAEQCRQNKLIMVENRHLAEINVKLQEYIKRKEKGAENEETRMICSSPYFCEDICSENRFHQTGDHFKGFSPEKIKEIIQSNSILLKEKQSSKRREIEEEQLWDQMQNRMLHQMEEIEQIKLDAKKEHQNEFYISHYPESKKRIKKKDRWIWKEPNLVKLDMVSLKSLGHLVVRHHDLNCSFCTKKASWQFTTTLSNICFLSFIPN